MYGSYSLLIVSLIPTFISAGELNNAVKRYNDGIWNYNKAKPYENVYTICSSISIGCGVLFVFELIRYFYAANSVLPQKAKNVPESKQIIFNQPFENPSTKEFENKNDQMNVDVNQNEEQSENEISDGQDNNKNFEEKKIDENNIIEENKNQKREDIEYK